MKRIFVMILSLVLILLGVTGCYNMQIDNISDIPNYSQSDEFTSSSDDVSDSEMPDQNTTPSDEIISADPPTPPKNNDESLFTYIDGYLKGLADEIPDDMIESYIDSALAEVQDAVTNGATVGIVFKIKNGTLNAAVQDLILTYAPQDLQDYPELEYGADRCMLTSVVLKHIDQADLRAMMFFIIKEDIVVDRSVKFIVL